MRIAAEKMAVVKGKKTEEVIPYREAMAQKQKILTEGRGKDAKERAYPKGDVYLENDKRERKATGSYYTPDYIVKYIVQNTVGPVLEEKFEKLRPKLREAQQAHRDAVKRKAAFEKLGKPGSDPEKVANTYRPLVDELFDVKVLDPAMGSGHFLVEAVDFITDRMIEFLNGFPWNPVVALLGRTRETILEGMNEKGINIDPARLTDVNLLKRFVLKRCIYGVDLNPMAVELAKVSLWLHCFTLGAPLSFLDHHLRCGNSLVGTSDVSEYILPTSPRYQDFVRARGNLITVASLSDATAGEVDQSSRLYKEALGWLAPFKKALNVQIARYFTELPGPLAYRAQEWAYKEYSNETPLNSESRSSWESYRRAQSVAEARRFFHWQLEFPEVFLGSARGSFSHTEPEHDNPGFDAVIGNPPWGATASSLEKQWYRERYEAVTKGVIDNFALFLERFTYSARETARIGILLPDIILLKNYPAARRFVLNHHLIREIVHWGQPFPDVNLDVCSIVSVRSENPQDADVISCIVDVRSWDDGDFSVNEVTHGTFRQNEQFKFNLHMDGTRSRLLASVESKSDPLSQFLELHEGIHSGNIRDKLFLDNRANDRCKPLIFGRDEVRPYYLRWFGKYVFYDKDIVHKKVGEYANLAHPEYFTKPKLLIRRTGDRIIAVTDKGGFFASNNLFVGQVCGHAGLPLEFFEAILNSKLATWYFRSIQPRKGRLFSELKIVHLRRIPVPRDRPPEFVQRIVRLVETIRKSLLNSGGEWNKVAETAQAQIDDALLAALGLEEQVARLSD